MSTRRRRPEWKPRLATGPRPKSEDAVTYDRVVLELDDARLDVACGVDHRGAWAKVGGATVRAESTGLALAMAAAKHLETMT